MNYYTFISTFQFLKANVLFLTDIEVKLSAYINAYKNALKAFFELYGEKNQEIHISIL